VLVDGAGVAGTAGTLLSLLEDSSAMVDEYFKMQSAIGVTAV
jgi:hypothetical protein